LSERVSVAVPAPEKLFRVGIADIYDEGPRIRNVLVDHPHPAAHPPTTRACSRRRPLTLQPRAVRNLNIRIVLDLLEALLAVDSANDSLVRERIAGGANRFDQFKRFERREVLDVVVPVDVYLLGMRVER
jgi:hypothetical protein